jgi:mannose-6-phosphate isomerase-like protein (cupin superfamily)
MSDTTPIHDLARDVVVIGEGFSAAAEAGGAEFWRALMAGERADVEAGWLVTAGVHEGTWPHWEMHPEGEELVVLMSGEITFVLDRDGEITEHRLDRPGQLVLVPRGAWHHARAEAPAHLLFVTAGRGTQHRPRTD